MVKPSSDSFESGSMSDRLNEFYMSIVKSRTILFIVSVVILILLIIGIIMVSNKANNELKPHYYPSNAFKFSPFQIMNNPSGQQQSATTTNAQLQPGQTTGTTTTTTVLPAPIVTNQSQQLQQPLSTTQTSCFFPTPANQQLISVQNVLVVSGQEINSLTPQMGPTNMINQDCSTFWNPSGDVFDYKLLFALTQPSQVQSIAISVLGDTVHDPSGIEIYSSSSFQGTPLIRAPLTTNSNVKSLNTSTVNLTGNIKFIQFSSQVNLSTNNVYVRFLPALSTRSNQPPANIIINKVQFFGLVGVKAISNKRYITKKGNKK